MTTLLFLVSLEDLTLPPAVAKAIRSHPAKSTALSIDILISSTAFASPAFNVRNDFRKVESLLSAVYMSGAAGAGEGCEVDVVVRELCGYDFGVVYPSTVYSEIVVTPGADALHDVYVRGVLGVSDVDIPGGYAYTAVGGTFDHLHIGHKLLLSGWLLLTKERGVCGVTGDKLLVNKKHAGLLESGEVRARGVTTFAGKFRRAVAVTTEVIEDIYGPTGREAGIQALVASEETRKGSVSVNEERARRGLPQLDIWFVQVVGADGPLTKTDGQKDEDHAKVMALDKLSSTAIRERLARKQSGEKL